MSRQPPGGGVAVGTTCIATCSVWAAKRLLFCRRCLELRVAGTGRECEAKGIGWGEARGEGEGAPPIDWRHIAAAGCRGPGAGPAIVGHRRVPAQRGPAGPSGAGRHCHPPHPTKSSPTQINLHLGATSRHAPAAHSAPRKLPHPLTPGGPPEPGCRPPLPLPRMPPDLTGKS